MKTIDPNIFKKYTTTPLEPQKKMASEVDWTARQSPPIPPTAFNTTRCEMAVNQEPASLLIKFIECVWCVKHWIGDSKLSVSLVVDD